MRVIVSGGPWPCWWGHLQIGRNCFCGVHSENSKNWSNILSESLVSTLSSFIVPHTDSIITAITLPLCPPLTKLLLLIYDTLQNNQVLALSRTPTFIKSESVQFLIFHWPLSSPEAITTYNCWLQLIWKSHIFQCTNDPKCILIWCNCAAIKIMYLNMSLHLNLVMQQANSERHFTKKQTKKMLKLLYGVDTHVLTLEISGFKRFMQSDLELLLPSWLRL